MSERMVFCQKLKREALGLSHLVYPGPLGVRIFDGISQEAWGLWLARQTMLINENRWRPTDPEDRALLEQAMDDFLFAGVEVLPSGYQKKTDDALEATE
jgi:Fe-S cluster biosynthesis and repair protein YggX